jgi:hypothetical protein
LENVIKNLMHYHCEFFVAIFLSDGKKTTTILTFQFLNSRKIASFINFTARHAPCYHTIGLGCVVWFVSLGGELRQCRVLQGGGIQCRPILLRAGDSFACEED